MSRHYVGTRHIFRQTSSKKFDGSQKNWDAWTYTIIKSFERTFVAAIHAQSFRWACHTLDFLDFISIPKKMIVFISSNIWILGTLISSVGRSIRMLRYRILHSAHSISTFFTFDIVYRYRRCSISKVTLLDIKGDIPLISNVMNRTVDIEVSSLRYRTLSFDIVLWYRIRYRRPFSRSISSINRSISNVRISGSISYTI